MHFAAYQPLDLVCGYQKKRPVSGPLVEATKAGLELRA